MPDTLSRIRFHATRTLMDGALRLAVAASGPSDRIWRWKNRRADGMVMACGFGGPAELLDIPEYPVTILARVGAGTERLELYDWDASSSPGSGLHRSDFALVPDLPAAPMFGPGGIHMFMTQDRGGDKHYFVRAYRDGKPHDSDIVFSKIDSQPTQRRDAALEVSTASAPSFAWPNSDGDVWTSFLMVLEGPERRLVTGIYSWDDRWTFPDIRRVPYFYHPETPRPQLSPGVDYEAVYVAVDRDRWITFLDSAKFTVPA
ncbi:MAG: hypothetical protein O6913_04005 [Chloroflexi bacterium]|nr:hypothetical protein [Chloroflexota bacterium]